MSDSNTLTVSPSGFLDSELVRPQERLLCGPGPSNLSENVIRSLTLPTLSPVCDEYFKVVSDIRHGIQYIFQTRSRAVFCVSGAGHAGMETVLGNLLEPGETVLVAMSGLWDDRASEMATRYGLKVKQLKKPAYEVYTPAEIEEGLRRYRPQALFIVQGDSTTGTLQPLAKFGDICEKYGALFIVDAVASCGGVPLFMDAWKIDGLYTGSQKVFSAPAGLSSVAFSEKAVKKLQSRRAPPPVYYFDANELMKQWRCFDNNNYYHHTICVVMMYALRAAFEDVAREGLQNVWYRTAKASNRFQRRISKLPIKFYVPKPENRLPTVVTLSLQSNMKLGTVIKFFKDNGIIINGGLGPTQEKALRIGFMGVNATDAVADKLADTLERALQNTPPSKL